MSIPHSDFVYINAMVSIHGHRDDIMPPGFLAQSFGEYPNRRNSPPLNAMSIVRHRPGCMSPSGTRTKGPVRYRWVVVSYPSNKYAMESKSASDRQRMPILVGSPIQTGHSSMQCHRYSPLLHTNHVESDSVRSNHSVKYDYCRFPSMYSHCCYWHFSCDQLPMPL